MKRYLIFSFLKQNLFIYFLFFYCLDFQNVFRSLRAVVGAPQLASAQDYLLLVRL